MSNALFNKKTLLQYLNTTADLNYSPEVEKELRDHRSKNLPTFIYHRKRKLSTARFTMNEYERRMIGKVLESRKKNGDKGEVDNLILAIDQTHHFKKNTITFICDDEKALNGVLKDWLLSFPVINVWTTYEVILHLYAEKIIPSKDIAVELVKEVISFTSPNTPERSEKTTQ